MLYKPFTSFYWQSAKVLPRPFSGYSALFSKQLKTHYSWDGAGRFEYHKPYALNKIGNDFLMDLSFFIRRFCKKIYEILFNKNDENVVNEDTLLINLLLSVDPHLTWRLLHSHWWVTSKLFLLFIIYAIEDDLKNESNRENKHDHSTKLRWSSVFSSGHNATSGQLQLIKQSLAILAPRYHSFICTELYQQCKSGPFCTTRQGRRHWQREEIYVNYFFGGHYRTIVHNGQWPEVEKTIR